MKISTILRKASYKVPEPNKKRNTGCCYAISQINKSFYNSKAHLYFESLMNCRDLGTRQDYVCYMLEADEPYTNTRDTQERRKFALALAADIAESEGL